MLQHRKRKRYSLGLDCIGLHDVTCSVEGSRLSSSSFDMARPPNLPVAINQIVNSSNVREVSIHQIANSSNVREVSIRQIANSSNVREVSIHQIVNSSNVREVSILQIVNSSNVKAERRTLYFTTHVVCGYFQLMGAYILTLLPIPQLSPVFYCILKDPILDK